MDATNFGKLREDCLVVNSHLKFLYLAGNSGLDDESLTMLASVSPNLEIIDLGETCRRISKGAIDVLRRYRKMQRMDLYGMGRDLPQFQSRVNSEVPTLPSLRKIVPPNPDSSDIVRQRDFFLRCGCFVLQSEDYYHEFWGDHYDY
ncbi:hypothetical protein PIB30_010420 [Stylosanthes scabra]|uniref:Uncharacterized protein n=1 Tax=Stylosanthes scabra TaxID=79078 RepID=A0ABU6X703_9FABA|nr:hypothetical protein [Stylosanthes scabra]